MVSKKIILGFILIVITATTITLTLPGEVRIKVTGTSSTFYVFENGTWISSGVEYNKLYSGNRLLGGVTKNISTAVSGNSTTITRTASYDIGAVIKDTYFFDGSVSDKERFPIRHTVEVINASGLIYEYYVSGLDYHGLTKSLTENSMTFGHNMKIEFDSGYSSAIVYEQGYIRIRYPIKSNDSIYNVRLFDPLVLYLDGTQGNKQYEIGSIANITCANVGNTCNITINSSNCVGYCYNITGYGQVNFTTYANQFKFNTGNPWSYFSANGTTSVYLDKYIVLGSDANFNIAWTSTGTTPNKVFIDFGADGYNDLNISGFSSGTQFMNNQTNVGTQEQLNLGFGQKILRAIELFKYVNYTLANVSLIGIYNTTYKETSEEHSCTGDATSCPESWDGNWLTGNGFYMWAGTGPTVSKSFTVYENYSVDPSSTFANVTINLSIWCQHRDMGGSSGVSYTVYAYNGPGATWDTINTTSYSCGAAYEGHSYTGPVYVNLGTRSTYFSDNKVKVKTTLSGSAFGQTDDSFIEYFESKAQYNNYPSVSIDLLNDGIIDYNNSNVNTTYTASLNVTALNNYVNSTCTTSICNVSIVFYTPFGGSFNYTALNFSGTYKPLSINTSAIRRYLDINASTTNISVPIRVNATAWGTFNMTNISIPFDGRITYNVTARNGSSSVSYMMDIFYSNWTYAMPTNYNFIEFIPATPLSKNVTPSGQTSSRPMLNITYGNLSMNASFFFMLNDTAGITACINTTVSNSSAKTNGLNMTSGTWYEFADNKNSTYNFGLWFWADYNCNYTTWKMWQPEFYFRSCCEGCVCSPEAY